MDFRARRWIPPTCLPFSQTIGCTPTGRRRCSPSAAPATDLRSDVLVWRKIGGGEMLASDPEYVCTRTVVLDLKILATTLKQILFPQRLF